MLLVIDSLWIVIEYQLCFHTDQERYDLVKKLGGKFLGWKLCVYSMKHSFSKPIRMGKAKVECKVYIMKNHKRSGMSITQAKKMNFIISIYKMQIQRTVLLLTLVRKQISLGNSLLCTRQLVVADKKKEKRHKQRRCNIYWLYRIKKYSTKNELHSYIYLENKRIIQIFRFLNSLKNI